MQSWQVWTPANYPKKAAQQAKQPSCSYTHRHTHRCKVELFHVIVRLLRLSPLWAEQIVLLCARTSSTLPAEVPPDCRHPALFSSGINVWHLSILDPVRACDTHHKHLNSSRTHMFYLVAVGLSISSYQGTLLEPFLSLWMPLIQRCNWWWITSVETL